ncbi:uncharacterized protein CMU_015760 [Cryptosporidium muris RN66]|uniref:Uncharacterized protein n=1 Tax=Cryptosporidium muris (strain RN66) TaxID=441375 RepID=B6ACH5_CRYMR|nr:uncharacterized protein CMU_015760 [Cryptosporidium muris RN66]EEA05829.1 hypothetical protein, conserved [Cryptosporidium muris RN66]|eukprot:XP_002140178.1 hypothetical protein [Cryptosporidium muris RN66]
MRQDILHINCSNECLELCLLTPQLQFIQRQLLKLCIRPSILILENLNSTDSLEALNLEFLLIEYQKSGQNSIRVVLVGSFTLSLFSDLFLPIYIVLKPKLNILDNSDNDGSISYINTGTCMCCIHSNLHFSFILDLSFSLRYLIRNRRREYTKLDLVILYFSEILKELFEAISALNRCIYKDSKSTSNINIRISILIFGINTNDSSYQLILHDTCISDCEVTSIFLDLIILKIQEEIGRLLYQSLEFYNSSYLTNNWWNFELKLYLDSLPSEFDKSVIIITDGIISKNLKAATEVYKDDQILCLNNDIIRTCISNDIQVHIVLVKDSEPEYKTSYGMVPSIETLEYLTRCCCNGSMTIVDEEIVDNLKLKQIVKNLLFRNTEVSIVDTLSIEELYLNCFLYKSYLLDKRISLLDIFASKMMIGYNLLFKDQLISIPVILVSQFHSFVNIYYTVDDYDYNRWSVKIYIQDINGIFKFNTLYNSEYESGTGYKQSQIANFELNSSTYSMDEQTCDIECLVDDNKPEIIFGRKLFSSGRSLYSKKDILFQNINLYINMMVNIDYLLNDISKVLSGQHLNLQSQKLIDSNENMYFSNINEKICFEDQTIWNIMRSWCSDICTKNINLELYEQIQNIKKDNRYYIQWLKLYRYLSKDEEENSELSSLVTIYSLYHGLNQQICEENSKKLLDNIYIKIMNFGDNYLVSGYNSVSAKFSYIENLKIGPEHLGVLSPVKSIEYILFSIINTQNCFVNQLQMKRSWKYMLWNTSSNIFDRRKQIFNKEYLSMFLSHRIISTLGKARYHENWILLYVKEISTNIRVVWIKFVTGKNQGNMNQKEIKDEIIILVYEISIIFDRNSSGSPIVCTLYMINQNNIINSLEPNYCDLFTYFLDYIQNQDNNIIKAISLINYLSNFNNIKNKVQFRRNSTRIFKSRSTINRRVNLNLEEMSILFLALSKRSSEEIEHFNNDTGKFTKSLDHINCIDQFSKCLIGSDNEYSVFENKKTQHIIKEFESYCSIEINPFKQDYSFEYFNTDNHEKRVMEKSKYLFWKSKMREIACDLLDKFINKINRRAEYSLRIKKYEWYLFNFLNSAKVSYNLRCNQTLNHTESEHIFNEHFLIIHIYPEKWSKEQFKKEKYIETTINDTNNYIELNILKLDFYIGNCNALCCGVTSNLKKIFFDNFDFSLYCKYNDNKCEGILNESIIEDSVNLYIQDVLYIWNTLRFKAICDYCTHNIPVHYRDIDILLDDRQSEIFFKNYIANMVYTSRDILNIDETISKMKHKPIKFSVPISIFQKVLYSAFKKLRPSSNILHYVSNNQDILKMIKCMESELIARIGTQTFGFQIVKTVSSLDHCDFITLFSQYSNYHKFGEIEITDNSFINKKDDLINCINSTEFRKEANDKLKRPLYLYNLKKYGYRPSLLVMKISSSSIELLDKQKSLIYSFIKLKGEKVMTSLNPNALTYWLFLITCLCILESSNLNIDIFIYEYNKCTKLKEYCTSKYFDIYEHFVEKLRYTIYHWIIDTAMELSFTHKSDSCLLEKIIGINSHRHSIDNLSLFGKDLFLECIQITQRVVWNQNNPDLNILQKLEHLHGSSIMYTSSIYIPLLPFFLKKNKDDYASLFNSFSSKVDLVPIQRDPLILLWNRNKKKILLNEEDEKINLQKDEYEYLDLNSIQNHFRIFISMQFDVDEIENLPNSEIKCKLNYLNNGSFTCVSSMNNQLLSLDDNNLYLKVSFFLYSPSSIELVKLQENNSSKIWCKFCNCKFLSQSLNEIISFCFSSIQERFIKMWKEFSIDFLLKNTINTKTASPYIIPIISEEPFASINDYCSPIEFFETAKSVHNNYEANLYMRIFGNPNTTSLYNIPFGMTPSYYLQTQNSLYHKSSRIEDTSNFGKITLWDGKQVQIPHYTFWLNPQDEISLEIPYNLFNIPLLDGFLTTNFTDNKIYNSSISCLAFQFASFTINSPEGWLCCSDDIILTYPLTSGTGSVFLIKPGYLLMNKSKDGKQSSSTVGLSLTFFGVRKPSKGTKGHFMKYLKIALQNFGKKTNNLDYSKNEFNEVLQLSSLKIGNDEEQIDDSTLIRRNSWSKSDLTGASNIVINTSPIYFNDSNVSLKFNSNNITDKNYSPKLLLQEIPLPVASAIWRMSSAFHNYIAISLWNIAKKTEIKLCIKDILLRFVKRLNIMGFSDIINEDLENNRSRVRFIIPKNVIMQFYNFKVSPTTENLNSKQKILSEYCIDIAIFSGIDGMPLPMNGAWGGGVRLGEQINSSIILLSIYEDDIDKWQQLIWDINENLDLLDLTTNNRTIRANIPNNTGSYSPWNILRNHEGHSIQVQPSLPVHIIPESFQDHSLNSTHSYKKANIWLMPCLYITADIWNFSKLLDYESALYEDNFGESSKFHTELLELVKSLLNLTLLDLAFELRFMKQEATPTKEHSNKEPQLPTYDREKSEELRFGFVHEINNDSSLLNNGDILIPSLGSSIRHLFKYKEELQNILQNIRFHENLVHKFSSSIGEHDNQTNTLSHTKTSQIMHYSVPILSKFNLSSSNDFQTQQLYNPSWSIQSLLNNIYETVIRENFSKNKNFKAYLIGHSCFIHDLEQLDKFQNDGYPQYPNTKQSVEIRNDDFNVDDLQPDKAREYLNINFSSFINKIQTIETRESGWHVSKYTSSLKYCEFISKDIQIWIDSLYEKNYRNLKQNTSNDMDFNSTFCSLFKLCGGRIRPRITIILYSSDETGTCEIENNSPSLNYANYNDISLRYYAFIDITPNGILLLSWYLPKSTESKLKNIFSDYIWNTTLYTLWLYQLIGWNNSIKDNYIPIIDLSPFAVSWDYISSSLLNTNYGVLCGLPIYIIYFIWSKYFNLHLYPLKSPEKLFSNVCVSLNIQIYNLKSCHNICSLMDGATPIFLERFDFFLEENHLTNEYVKYNQIESLYPSVLQELISQQANQFIKEWMTLYSKYRFWNYISLLLTSTLSNWNREVNLIKLKSDQVDFNFSHKLLNIYDIFEDKFYNTLEFLLEEMELIFLFFSKKKMSHLSVFPSKLLNYSNENNNVNIEKYSTHLNLLYTLSDFKSQLVEILEYITRPNLQHYHNWLLHPELEENFESDTYYNRVNIHNATLDNETTCYIPKDLGCLKCLEDFQTISISLIIAILLLDKSPKTKIQRVNIKKGIQIQQAKTSYKYSDKQSYDISLVIYKQIFKDLPFCSSSQSYYLNVLNSLTEAIDRHMNMMNMIRIKHSFSQPLSNSSNIYIIIRILRTFSLIRSNYIFQDNLQHLSQNIFQEAPLIPLQISQELIYIGTLYNDTGLKHIICLLFTVTSQNITVTVIGNNHVSLNLHLNIKLHLFSDDELETTDQSCPIKQFLIKLNLRKFFMTHIMNQSHDCLKEVWNQYCNNSIVFHKLVNNQYKNINPTFYSPKQLVLMIKWFFNNDILKNKVEGNNLEKKSIWGNLNNTIVNKNNTVSSYYDFEKSSKFTTNDAINLTSDNSPIVEDVVRNYYILNSFSMHNFDLNTIINDLLYNQEENSIISISFNGSDLLVLVKDIFENDNIIISFLITSKSSFLNTFSTKSRLTNNYEYRKKKEQSHSILYFCLILNSLNGNPIHTTNNEIEDTYETNNIELIRSFTIFKITNILWHSQQRINSRNIWDKIIKFGLKINSGSINELLSNKFTTVANLMNLLKRKLGLSTLQEITLLEVPYKLYSKLRFISIWEKLKIFFFPLKKFFEKNGALNVGYIHNYCGLLSRSKIKVQVFAIFKDSTFKFVLLKFTFIFELEENLLKLKIEKLHCITTIEKRNFQNISTTEKYSCNPIHNKEQVNYTTMINRIISDIIIPTFHYIKSLSIEHL